MEEWGLTKYTILDRVDEIERAVGAGLYQAALALALTLPDICGEVESPEAKTGERYRTWFDKHVSQRYLPKTIPAEEPEKRILTGSVCYQLRCAYLHSGNDDVGKRGKNSIVGSIDSKYETTYRFHLTTDVVDTLECYTDESKMTREYVVWVNVPGMCTKICEAVKEFKKSLGGISAFDQNSFSLYSSKKWEQDRNAFWGEE